MGHVITASPVWDKRDGYWYCRPWIGGVRQKRVRASRIAEHDIELARRWALGVQQYCDAHGCVPGERDLTFGEYAATYLKSCESMPSHRNIKVALEGYGIPRLGPLPMRALDRERLLDFVHSLDQDVRDDRIGAKTAENIWYTIRAMLRKASRSKNRALRVLDFDPTQGVPPPDPDSAGDKQKQMLFPDEFLALLSCEDVPVARARLYAVALLAHARSAELRALSWDDGSIDIEHRSIRITKQEQRDRSAKATNAMILTATKGKKAREVTIEETLVPLLEAMRTEAGGEGRVFPDMPRGDGEYGVCNLFHRDLERAGIDRPELLHATPTSLACRFHDLRASGITWRAARGDSPHARRQEAGHEDQATNDLYLRKLRTLYGANLFPELPARLFAPPPPARVTSRKEVAAKWPQWPQKRAQTPRKSWAQQGLNLRLRPCEGRTLPLSYAPGERSGRYRRLYFSATAFVWPSQARPLLPLGTPFASRSKKRSAASTSSVASACAPGREQNACAQPVFARPSWSSRIFGAWSASSFAVTRRSGGAFAGGFGGGSSGPPFTIAYARASK